MAAGQERANHKKPDLVLQSTVAADKLHGVYPQRQTDLYMQRIKIPGGRIQWQQWQVIAQLQERFSPGTPVHLTTRQDIELHNLRLDDTVKVQQILVDAGFSVYGACGDSLRNITVCPGCGFCKDGRDVFDISEMVKNYLQSRPAILNLPRKFKISFSGCRQSCAKPYLNDIGFIAVSEEHFEVVVGGSLGPVPALGIKAYEQLPVSDIFALCCAAVEMFVEYGDRKNRIKARFRHVREKLGNDAFLSELDKRFRGAKNKEPRSELNLLTKTNSDFKLLHRLNIPDGDISAKHILLLADLCRPCGIESRINFEHGIELYGLEPLKLPESLKAFENASIITCCPGNRSCPYGLINCQLTASMIRDALADDKRFNNVRINISGCPNNCAHSAAAAIGLVGLKREKEECVQLYIGGGEGKNQNLAQKGGVENVKNITPVFFSK